MRHTHKLPLALVPCLLLAALCLSAAALAAPEPEPDYSTLTLGEDGKYRNCQGVVFTLQRGDESNTAWVGTGEPDNVRGRNNAEYTSASENYNDGNLVIPDTVTYGGQTYTVTYISTNAFRGTSGNPNFDLKTVTIGKSVRDIAFSAFYYCPDFTEFKVDKNSESFCAVSGVLFDGNKQRLRCVPGGKALESYEIPAGVRYVDVGAFLGCKNVSEVRIVGDGLTVCDYAFYDATGLKKATVSGGVATIGNRVFEGCTALTELQISGGVKRIGNRLCCGCTSLKSLYVYDGVEMIGDDPLVGCSALERLTLPFLGASPTAGCFFGTLFTTGSLSETASNDAIERYNGNAPSSLTDVTIAGGKLFAKAFRCCVYLEKITLGRAITEIPDTCFGYCTSLTQLDMGLTAKLDGENHAKPDEKGRMIVRILPHIQSVGNWAFYACPHIYRFDVDEKNAVCANDYWGVLYDKSFRTLLCYPPASDCQYYCVKGSAELVKSFSFSRYCDRLITVNIPSSDTALETDDNGDMAFRDAPDGKIKVCVHRGSQAESDLDPMHTGGRIWIIEEYKPTRVDLQRLADNLACPAGSEPAFENLHIVAVYPGTTILLDPLDCDLTCTALTPGAQTVTAAYKQTDAAGKTLSVSFNIQMFDARKDWTFKELSLPSGNAAALTKLGLSFLTAFYDANGRMLHACPGALIDNAKNCNSLRYAVYLPAELAENVNAETGAFTAAKTAKTVKTFVLDGVIPKCEPAVGSVLPPFGALLGS